MGLETGERCRCRSLPITPPASLRSHGSRPRPTRHNTTSSFLFYFCRVYISLESSAILDKYFHWVCCSAFWDLSSLWRPCAMLSSNWGILEGNMMFLSMLILHVRGAHMIPKESNLEADDMTPENPTPFAFTWYISAWDFPTGLSCLSLRSTLLVWPTKNWISFPTSLWVALSKKKRRQMWLDKVT